jgi:hypothetical protein
MNNKINNDLQKIIELNDYIIKQTIGLINRNYLINNNPLSLAIEKKAKELYISQRNIYIVIQKVINFSIIGNKKQQSEIKSFINAPKSYPIKNEKINFEKFSGGAYNTNQNTYPQESKKFQTVKYNIQKSLINNNSANNKHKIKKHIFYSQVNNEIKLLKNKKVVYLSKTLLNAYSTSRTVKKFKKITVKFTINI